MGYVAVDNLKQGMVLDEDVQDMNTRLLLCKGQKIAQKHIRVLKIWGVSGVSIVGSVNENAGDALHMDDRNLEHLKDAINLVYKNADLKNPLLREIYKNALIQRIKGSFGNVQQPFTQTLPGSKNLGRPDNIKRQIDQTEIKLPETPPIISELNQVIADQHTTSFDLAQVVNKSPSLSALLLKIVNSPYYGFPSKIDRISRAVTIIGTKEISRLAMGICVMQTFEDIPKDVLNMEAFIRHSLACGIVSRILAAQNNMAQTEQLFVAGLLHDVGKLIVYKYYPDHAKACLDLGFSSDTSIFKAEKEILGLNHPQIAKILLKKWNLPNELTNIIVYHHAPGRATDPEKAGIVHLADILVHGIGIGSSGERSVPYFDHPMLAKIIRSNASIKMVIRQIVHQFEPMDTIFSGLQSE